MNKGWWQTLFVLSLVLLSVALYVLHFVFFHDAHHIFIYLVGDLAFLPLEVLLVNLFRPFRGSGCCAARRTAAACS